MMLISFKNMVFVIRLVFSKNLYSEGANYILQKGERGREGGLTII